VTTYDWHTLYTDAVTRFGGDTPGNQLEQQILDTFTDHPQLVVRAIDKVAAKYAAGHVQSPWGALKHEIARFTNQPHVTATDSSDRDRDIARAEQWIRSAGIHLDRASELHDELFGELGSLHTYAQITIERAGSTTDGKPIWRQTKPSGDTTLVDRLTALWREHRPVGEQLETEAIERAERWKQQQAQLQEAIASMAATTTETTPAATGIPPSKRDPDSDIPF
jgi:hypothetical protein